MTHPFIRFHTLSEAGDYYSVRSGRAQRDYLDNTFQSHGYHCQALTSSHLSGWEILLPQDVQVVWDGQTNSEPGHVKILSGEFLPNGKVLVQTDTANATIAFNLNATIETDPEHDLVLCGPPNYFIDGAEPMTAIIQTSWYTYNPLQYCWKLNKPNEIVTFKAGTPFVFFFNRSKTLLENTDLVISSIDDNKLKRISFYSEERSSFYKNNKPWSWSGMYKNGLESFGLGSKKHIESVFRPKPKEPRYE